MINDTVSKFFVKTLHELMEFQNVKLKVYLGNHELSHSIRTKCALKEYLQVKLEREVELQGLCLHRWEVWAH